MYIEVVRIANVKNASTGRAYCIGKMYIDKEYVCDTIEDYDRGLNSTMSVADIQRKKVYGKTAIPIGTYCVTLGVQSSTFVRKEYFKKLCNGYLPRLLDVKGYSGVLIHTGNTEEDSLGCLLVGYNKQVGKVLNSREAFEKVYNRMSKAFKSKDTLTLKISRKYSV